MIAAECIDVGRAETHWLQRVDRTVGVQEGANGGDRRLRLLFNQPMPGVDDHHLMHVVSSEAQALTALV